MCGICGFWTLSGNAQSSVSEEILLDRMCGRIAHRGPDAQGSYALPPKGLYLGHRRLSIIDLESGGQPLPNEDGSVWITFNGEIYNFPELRETLGRRGHLFRTRTDTEAIVHAYEEWGADCVKRLRGMFAFAIWDDRKRRLFCARDRLGIKPLYFYHDEQVFVFSSELKALIEHPAVPREVCPLALMDYLRLFYIPSPRTIYRSVFKLPAGHHLLVDESGLREERYWHLPHAITVQSLSLEEGAAGLRTLLDEAVGMHMVSDVPLGAFLSGGVDSSTVVALMSAIASQPVQTHCVGFDQSEFDESTRAREIAARFGCDHRGTHIDIDVKGLIEKLIWHLDEPLADSSAIPTYYVCREARSRTTVCLSGDGGDELFSGYNWYAELLRVARLQRLMPHGIRGLARQAGDILPHAWRGKTLLQNLGGTPPTIHENLIKGFSDAHLERLLRPEHLPREGFAPHPLSERHAEVATAFGDSVTRSQYVDLATYMVEDILMKVDKMSMATSLEVRVPLLDHKVVEFAFSLPVSLKIRGGERKIVLKESVADLIPRSFFQRRKQGFSVPLRQWLLKDLHSCVNDTLLSSGSRCREFFSPKEIQRLWAALEDTNRHIDVSSHLWALFCLELWHRIYR